MTSCDYTNYLSPFTWRYGSDEMRLIWSEINKRRIWRQIWVSLAEAQAEFGLVTQQQVTDLKVHADQINIPRALEIEAEIRHDLMAEIRTYAEQCPIGGGIIHLGMTSMDIVDNADALRVRASLDLILSRLQEVLVVLAEQMKQWADTPVMAFTHLQPAEPTTLGYRLAQYAQDLLMDWKNLNRLCSQQKGKGLKGAVGTSASYVELIGSDNLEKFEQLLSDRLGLPFFPITTQVYPRKQDYDILSALAGLGASIHKFCFDLRLLQSPTLGELAEPFGSKQVGSSAMPFKRNPVKAEQNNSLARLLAQLPRVAWDNAAFSLLERTIDDSANRRSSLPEAFLIADELLITTNNILAGLQVDQNAMQRNLETYGPFAATERVLMALGKAGADRQKMHERLREHAIRAWNLIQQGKPNPLMAFINNDTEILEFLTGTELRNLMDASNYIGDAATRTRRFVAQIFATLEVPA
jgi:adenylosuccinate lyase